MPDPLWCKPAYVNDSDVGFDMDDENICFSWLDYEMNPTSNIWTEQEP